jgi:hypothetical protein
MESFFVFWQPTKLACNIWFLNPHKEHKKLGENKKSKCTLHNSKSTLQYKKWKSKMQCVNSKVLPKLESKKIHTSLTWIYFLEKIPTIHCYVTLIKFINN